MSGKGGSQETSQAYALIQVRDDCDSDQDDSTEYWLDSRYILKVEPLRVPDGIHVDKND